MTQRWFFSSQIYARGMIIRILFPDGWFNGKSIVLGTLYYYDIGEFCPANFFVDFPTENLILKCLFDVLEITATNTNQQALTYHEFPNMFQIVPL